MKTEELSECRQIYFDINIPDNIVSEKWALLAPLLPEQRGVTKTPILKYGIAFLASVFILVTGTAGASQAAKPGEPLYPIKELTREVTTKVSSVITNAPSILFEKNVEKPQEIKIQELPEEEDKEEQKVESEENKPTGNQRSESNSRKEEVKGITNNNQNNESQSRGNSEEAQSNQEEKKENNQPQNNPGSDNRNDNPGGGKPDNPGNGNQKNNKEK